MKIGCCITENELDVIENAGFDFFELPGSAVARMEEEKFHVLQKKVRHMPISCQGFNAALPADIKICGMGFDLERAEQYMQLLCSRASELGVKWIGVGSPKSRPNLDLFPEKTAWQQALTFMRCFCEIASPFGIQVLWETLSIGEAQFGIRMKSGAEQLIVPLKQEGVENTGLLVDLFHMRQGGEHAETLKSWISLVSHSHISGNRTEERGYPDSARVAEFGQELNMLKSNGCSLSIEALEGDIVQGAKAGLSALRNVIE